METPKVNAERIKKYLKEGKRFDSRSPDEFRELVIENGVSKNAEGSARVKLGKTEIIVGVKLGVAEPYPDSPTKGNLMVTAELSPMSSDRFENGPPKFPAIELGRVLDRVIRESGYIDVEKLCIKEGEKVWTVFIDIYTVNDDGNLFDACGIGILAALNFAKLPKYDEKEEKILYDEPTDKKLPLASYTPISITYHKIGDSIVVDPTREEEDISEARVTIGSFDSTISSMQKGNSAPLKMEEMEKILDMNEKVNKDIFKKISKFLK